MITTENTLMSFVPLTVGHRFTSAVDIRLQTSVGKALPAVLRGETTMLEHMLPDNMLDDFYTHGLGFATYNQFLARMVNQLAHRYPRMKFIEIGVFPSLHLNIF